MSVEFIRKGQDNTLEVRLQQQSIFHYLSTSILVSFAHLRVDDMTLHTIINTFCLYNL